MDTAIWAALIAAVASIAGILIQKKVRDRSKKEADPIDVALNQVKGGIDKPAANQQVGRTIHCTGWARDLEAGLHLWLAVESGGFVWFKENEIYVDGNGRWEANVYEDGATQEFVISLFVANGDAHKQIHDWFQIGFGTGEYPELKRVAGTIRLDRVDGLRLS
ncbi:MAG TPA: hypothetical protein VKB86_03695 [Pyrinomonadaceae bacterium]|nr:hypothetical protein [Pyrinomonadaceae bacterium]